MAQRATGRSVRRAGATRKAVELDHLIPRSPRPEPEGRHSRPEDRHGRRADGLREMQRGTVVRYEYGRAPDDLSGLPQREPTARIHRPPPSSTALHRLDDLLGQPRVLRPAAPPDPHPAAKPLRHLSLIRPALRAPDRPGGERDELGADPVLPQKALRRRAIR